MSDLSQVAAFAKTSLTNYPERNTPETIASAIDQMEPIDVAEGLRELAAAGLAEETPSGWRLLS